MNWKHNVCWWIFLFINCSLTVPELLLFMNCSWMFLNVTFVLQEQTKNYHEHLVHKKFMKWSRSWMKNFHEFLVHELFMNNLECLTYTLRTFQDLSQTGSSWKVHEKYTFPGLWFMNSSWMLQVLKVGQFQWSVHKSMRWKVKGPYVTLSCIWYN